MPDIALSFRVSRGDLGLPDLELNDSIKYKIADTMLGGQKSYQRTQVTGPYCDGSTTVSRQLQMVTEPVNIEVYGRTVNGGAMTAPRLQANIIALIQAITQNDFSVQLSIDGMVEQYACEASDHQIVWTGPRWIARQSQVQVQLLRQPRALVGGM